MFSKSIKILLLSAIFAGIGSSAYAQEMEEFKARMADAAAMTKQDLSEALRQYLEIRVQFSGPEVDYSLGRAYQRMNQCKDAQQYYTQVMVNYNLPETNSIYQRAVKAFDEISNCDAWQKFYLECEIPTGGYVMIDEERIGTCWQRPYSLAPGDHKFMIVDASGKSETVNVKAALSKPDEHVKLAIHRVETVEVEKRVEIEKTYEMKEKFHPALYWGLMLGGAVLVAGGGFFSAYANHAYSDEKDYAYKYAIWGDDSYKKKADDAHDQVKLGNTLMYTFVGIGGAAAITGAVLAIVSAVSEKERVEVNDVSAYASPLQDGVSFGIHMNF
ncbi:MAG: hypothetical protein J6A01_00355 [Proteobacteria bacterium]|nr:hypothetical protein [Pseudomonadota bacterium]